MKALKDILESGTKEDLETKTSELSDAVQKVGASMYQNQPAGEQPSAGQGEDKSQSGNGKKSRGAGSGSAGKDEKKVEEGEVVS